MQYWALSPRRRAPPLCTGAPAPRTTNC